MAAEKSPKYVVSDENGNVWFTNDLKTAPDEFIKERSEGDTPEMLDIHVFLKRVRRVTKWEDSK